MHALASYPVLLAGTEEQKRRICPLLVSGRLGAYALSEPDSGSDAASLSTTAVRDGSDYVLNGSKCFITHGSVAELMVVFARTQRASGPGGISAFILDRDQSPWTVLKVEKKMGIKGSDTAQIAFDDVRVPVVNRLGEEGQGFEIAKAVLDRSRPAIGAQALGIAEGALEYAHSYVKERRQFGQPISSFQAVRFMLADMATWIEAARHLVYEAARRIDNGDEGIREIASMAKLFASDAAMKVTGDAVQLLGGYGYLQDHPVERFMRDAKVTQIYEGTNQIQRLVISRELLRAGRRESRAPASTSLR